LFRRPPHAAVFIVRGLARIRHEGIEHWPSVEEVAGAGLERNRWWFHRLSEAQAGGPADRSEPISPKIRGTGCSRVELQASAGSINFSVGFSGDLVTEAGQPKPGLTRFGIARA